MKDFRNITLLLSAVLMLCLFAGCQESEDGSALNAGNNTSQIEPVSIETKPVETEPAVEGEKSATVSDPKATQDKPVIKVEKPEINFGKLHPKDKVKGEYIFKNSGTGTLTIEKIQKSCGCTSANIATLTEDGKVKMNYEPGESGRIEVAYSAPAKPGPASQTVKIHSNAINKKIYVCRLKAVVETAVAVIPARVEVSLRADKGGIKPIKLTSTDGEAFKIISFSSTKNIIRADFDPNEEATEFVLQPEADLSKFVGKMLGGVINIALSHPKARSVKIQYNAKPLWVTRPATLLLMNAERGSVTQRELFIKSNYGEKVEIDSVNSENGYIKVLSQKEDGNSVRISVEITLPDIKEEEKRFIKDKLTINLKGGDVLDIGCTIYFAKEK